MPKRDYFQLDQSILNIANDEQYLLYAGKKTHYNCLSGILFLGTLIRDFSERVIPHVETYSVTDYILLFFNPGPF